MPVPEANPPLSSGLSLPTRHAAYEPFTPNKSGQRSHPTYYRGCWHVVSRCFFPTYTHPGQQPGTWWMVKGVYNPKAVIPHAASLRQASAHCAIFPTAASRRSLGRVSVPVWPVALSGRLPVNALVGHHPTNKLIGRGPIPGRKNFPPPSMHPVVVSGISPGFPELSQSQGQVTHVLLTRSPLTTSPKTSDPFDLHVLSTPPAFVLSQDQTLQKRCLTNPAKPSRRGSGQSTIHIKWHHRQKCRHTVEFSRNRHTSRSHF